MTLFILTETSAGYALLKAKDKKLLQRDDLEIQTEDADGVSNLMKLKNFQKFDNATTALEEVASLVEGKVTARLAKLLEPLKDEKKASLAVADPKLGIAIGKLPGLSVKLIADSSTAELYRAIRAHLPSLIPGLVPADLSTMSLGLSHSLARYKLKFSPDRIDTMIIQAIALLDDLDKELNIYAMRVKEWYGWHFPELAKILNDNLAYTKVVLKMGMRSNSSSVDLAEILPEEIEGAVKAAADRSMGTDISVDDLDNIQALADQVVGFSEYRQQLAAYLSARMNAIAPNLTALVGDLVGARLIAHAGSLMNLSKSPASTIQILGAEKALFRALKTKHDTPKYGLIYHASLVGQATGKNKGKIARVLAAKAAIGLRVDALAEWGTDADGNEPTEEERAALGLQSRYYVEKKLAALEGKPLKPRGVAIAPSGVAAAQPKKFEIKEARKYNPDADGLVGDEAPPAADDHAERRSKKSKKDKDSKKSKLIQEVQEEDEEMSDAGSESEADVEGEGMNGHGAEPSPQTALATESESESEEEGEEEEEETPKKKEKRHKDKSEIKHKKEKKRGAVTTNDDKDKQHTTNGKEDNIEEMAMKLGLSTKRYRKKLKIGEINFDSDGNPSLLTNKKELKTTRKESRKEAKAAKSAEKEAGKKRKRDVKDDEQEARREDKKKTKKSKV